MRMSDRDATSTGSGGSTDLLLGAGVEFEGKLTFKGTVHLDARFSGSIVTEGILIVGEHARVDAQISCGTVIVHGQVNGDVKAREAVALHRTGKLRGDVETPALTVERGALLQGAVRMDGGTRAIAKLPPAVAAVR
jgi:cytoskeletal protein CcmA (bactofilin family)